MPKFKDLTGLVFGRLLVIKRVENSKNNKIQYLCKCDCGNEKIILGASLLNGRTVSCGCYKSEIISKTKRANLVGQKFNRLTVIKGIGSNKRNEYLWLCKCDCGEESIVCTGSLISGNTNSCGCLQKEITSKTHLNDLTGEIFGRLTVIKRVENNKYGQVMWLCKCTCGNETIVIGCSLKSGLTKSCGCLKAELASERYLVDLTGNKYGRLTVIKQAQNKYNKTAWLCKCDCDGKEIIVEGGALKTGNTQSCGCLHTESTINMNKQRCGENHPLWKGGISFEPYCPKFNNQKKEEIRDKYNRVCLICGKTEVENGRKLDIHHVDYQKDQGCGDHKWKLVPLCKFCHSKTNHNRTFWEYNIKWILAQRKSKERYK